MKHYNNNISEAKRYLHNAREILKTKGGNGVPGYYSDKKYVRMACHTAWIGILEILNHRLPHLPKGKRRTVKDYERYLATRNKKTLNDFVAAYQVLHLSGGYDGILKKSIIEEGIELAEEIIRWCEKN